MNKTIQFKNMLEFWSELSKIFNLHNLLKEYSNLNIPVYVLDDTSQDEDGNYKNKTVVTYPETGILYGVFDHSVDTVTLSYFYGKCKFLNIVEMSSTLIEYEDMDNINGIEITEAIVSDFEIYFVL